MSAVIPPSSHHAEETTSRAIPATSTPAEIPGTCLSSQEHDGNGGSSSSPSSSSRIHHSLTSTEQQQQQQTEEEEQQEQQHQQEQEEEQLGSLDRGEGEGSEEEVGELVVAANDSFPSYGLVSFIGRRKEMEDAATVVSDLLSLPCEITRHSTQEDHHSSHHFFGVYDGHGGSQVALFCKSRLHHALVEELHESISSAGYSTLRDVESWDPVWERAMESCFLKVDGEIGSMCLKPGNCDKCEGNTGVCSETVGSTAVVAVVGCCRIVVANCGDSRVVLSRGGKALPLSADHKPEREDEMQRIEDAGGKVIFWNGYRVMGMLAMSRAIGDRYLDRYVIPNPDVRCIRRCEDDEFIVLASDGLWDVLTNEQVCDVTRMCLAGRCNGNVNALAAYMHGTANTQARLAAAYLTKLAYNRRSADNISVVVVDLKSGETAVSSSAPVSSQRTSDTNATTTSTTTTTTTPTTSTTTATATATTTPVTTTSETTGAALLQTREESPSSSSS